MAGPSPEAPITCAFPAELAELAPLALDDLVRLGDAGDGGYVVPRAIVAEAGMLLSFGLGDNWSFEAACRAQNPQLHIHVYDHTVPPSRFRDRYFAAFGALLTGRGELARLREARRKMHEYRRFFGAPRTRHFPRMIHDRQDFPFTVTIDMAMERARGREVICKCDIEGGEYRIVGDLARHADRLPLLAIEFHDTDLRRGEFHAALSTLRGRYDVAHLHANNAGGVGPDGVPRVLEITFLRRDLCPAGAERRPELPLPGLDAPNYPLAPDLKLVFPPAAGQPGATRP